MYYVRERLRNNVSGLSHVEKIILMQNRTEEIINPLMHGLTYRVCLWVFILDVFDAEHSQYPLEGASNELSTFINNPSRMWVSSKIELDEFVLNVIYILVVR